MKLKPALGAAVHALRPENVPGLSYSSWEPQVALDGTYVHPRIHCLTVFGHTTKLASHMMNIFIAENV